MSELIAIPRTGRKPAWLEDDALVNGPNDGFKYTVRADAWTWMTLAEYRLPADHWAYPVLKLRATTGKNWTPWNPTLQGDGPPSDWDGGKVMLRGGALLFGEWVSLSSARGGWPPCIGYIAAPAEPAKPAPELVASPAIEETDTGRKTMTVELTAEQRDQLEAEAELRGRQQMAHSERAAQSVAEAWKKRALAAEEALGDLMSWFPQKAALPEWRIQAGDGGADDAVEHCPQADQGTRRRRMSEDGTCTVCHRAVKCRTPVRGDGSASFPYRHKDAAGNDCIGRHEPRVEDRRNW